MNLELKALAERIGVHYMNQPNLDFQVEGATLRMAHDGFACDAQPTLVTTSNSGIPAFLSTYIDPKQIEILVSPMKAAEVTGQEVKKGDWLTETAMFPVIESTGEVSAYGDYNENGRAGVNFTFPQRQSYMYQVFTQWGERELERAGLARIDWANRLTLSSILTLNKFQNKTYFFGVSGLQNYGLINDPNLLPAIAPTTKVAGGTTWAVATALEIFADIQKLYTQVQSQCGGLLDLETPMTLAMSTAVQVYLADVTSLNIRSVRDTLKATFPNMRLVTAPEYTTASGNVLQLIVDSFEGQRTADCAFTEKLRAHPIVVNSSSFKQKKSQGTWGTIIYRPAFIGNMIGV